MAAQHEPTEDLLLWIVRRLVDDPESVWIDRTDESDTTVIRLHVAPADVGKVIGRQGRIVRALRTIVRSAGGRSNRRTLLEIVE